MNDDITTEPFLLYDGDEADMCLMVEEPSYRELSSLLEELPRLKGSSFVRQLKEIMMACMSAIFLILTLV